MEKQNKGMNLIQKLYHYRLKIDRKGTPIVNLSSLFCIPALLLAPWVSIGGIVAALALGYHIRLETEGEGTDIQQAVSKAAETVKKTVSATAKAIRQEVDKVRNDAQPAREQKAAPKTEPVPEIKTEKEDKPEVNTTPDFTTDQEEVVNDLEKHMDAFFQGNPASANYRSAYSATANSVPTIQVHEEAAEVPETGRNTAAGGQA